jgi:hypothetical protein
LTNGNNSGFMHRVRAAAMNSADRGTTAILQAPFQTSGGTNSPARIEARLRAGKISPLGLALMLPARLVFAFLTFGLVTLIALASGTSHPVTAAASWWMVSGTLIDIGCLIALTLLTRREGIRLVDLLGLGNRPIFRELLFGLVLVLALIPALAITQVLTFLFYSGHFPPQITLVHLPAWATVYSIIVWPVIWALTEQMTYMGYLFPRLEVLTRRTLFAAAIVLVVWSLQHLALPFVPDGRYVVYRTITTLPIAMTAVVLYLFVLRRRLLPLVVVHWMADVFAALSPVLFASH